MSCSELNFQVHICIACYDSHDKNVIIYLAQPYNLIVELDPEENDQAFDIVIPNHITDPGGDNTDSDEEYVHNNTYISEK